MKSYFIVSAFFYLLLTHTAIKAQFAPPAMQEGSSAMYKDSSAFISWATKCNVVRGFQDISNESLGLTNVGDSSLALGPAGTNGVVSLGDGGTAILEFASPIKDGTGPDFAVFENAFDDLFLELAFVEVSSDGIHYYRFPAICNSDTNIQTGSFDLTDATKLHNFAGKYRAEYGTPFDLSDLPNGAFLNKQAITHVKIIDVVGCIQNQYCSRDANNHKVNDPWPTNFPNGGFDLDAVGVIHQQAVGVDELNFEQVRLYPNPANDILYVNLPSINYSLDVLNVMGEVVLKSENKSNTTSLSLIDLKQGIYTLVVKNNSKQKQIKFVKL